jgi:Protein kinase domain/WD40-like Beta Propeller Repeat
MIGDKLGHYEIETSLGAGGMGEVYRARDTRLGRSVAVKVLSEAFAKDPERIARFEREAKVLASLNHSNIAALHGFEQSGETHFLVMELVQGETLAERISRGPIPAEEALTIAHQMAEALEAAHEKGIVHRDLKPANVKITPEGKVKVLDFGLAKAMESAPAYANLSNSPTLSVMATNAGMILGTAAYMSPEQARGENTDGRSDIFSFGCVLYEVLTGRQGFQGRTVSDILASVLARELDFSMLPARLNPKISQLIRRAVEKEPKRRWQAVGDMRVEIEAAMANPYEEAAVSRPLWKRAIPIVVTAVVVATAMAGIMWNPRTTRPAGLTRFPFVIPEGERFTRTGRHVVAISPDGANLVYVANNQLYLRTMAEMESRPIQGTNLDADTPFFSPDGRWVGFHSAAESKIKKIATAGGTSVTICDSPLPYGATWTTEGQVLIGAGPAGILRVSENGGKPETVVSVKAGEVAHGPELLPGGKAILFTLANGTSSDRWDKGQIVVQSLKSGERKTVWEGGSDARYVPTGHIVYASGSTLLAIPFDVQNLTRTGGPVPVIEGVFRANPTATAAAHFDFSQSGSMVYVPGTADNSNAGRILALVDRSGARKPIPVPPAPYFQPRISPNGKQLVVSTDDGKDAVVWVYDLAGTTSMRKLTFGGDDRFPLWSRDGQRVAFQSKRGGDVGLFWQRADGNGSAERLAKPEQKQTLGYSPDSWSLDGRTLIFSSVGGNDTAIWSISTERDAKPKVLIDTPSKRDEFSSISPDGHWIAYTSYETGPAEIYVQTFPPTSAKYQLTTTGGFLPTWSPDGKQIFFVQGRFGVGRIALIDVQTQPSFVFSKPTPLPIEGIIQNGGAGMPRGYDITPDGKQFVVMLPPSEAEAATRQVQQIHVTLNWFEELKQRVAVK